MKAKQYPEGTRFNNWVVVHDLDEGKRIPRIRRWVIYPNGKKSFERYDTKKYSHFRDNQKELENFVIRLNGSDPNEKRAKLSIKFRHAYIDPDMLTEYQEHLETQIPSKKHATVEFTNLQRYFLSFFIVKLGIVDPVLWHRHQHHWAKALLNKIEKDDIHFQEKWRLLPVGEIRSAKTIRTIIHGANRFMQFLHQRRPSEVPPLKFNPIGRARYKELEARRKANGDVLERKAIKDSDWDIIAKELPEDFKSWALLSYYYGLRRSEAMAVDASCIWNNHLLITKQLVSAPTDGLPTYGPLKGRKDRKIPHWFCKPERAFELVSEVKSLMYPDTFSKRWAEFMGELGMDYDIHDIRHTWMTRAGRIVKNYRDVQMAAGHQNAATTMKYMHDDRGLEEDQPFIPKNSTLKVAG